MILNIFVNDRALIYPQVENLWFEGFKFHSILPDWVDKQSVFCRQMKRLEKYFYEHPPYH